MQDPLGMVRQAGGRDEVCSVRDNMQVHTVRASHAGALRTVVRTVVVCIASDKHTNTFTAHSLAFDEPGLTVMLHLGHDHDNGMACSSPCQP